MNRLSRREFLRLLSLGSAGFIGTEILGACTSEEILTPAVEAIANQTPDVEINLTATPDSVNIFSGQPTKVWRYLGKVIKGSADILQTIPDSYLGSLLQLHTGQRVRINFKNELPEKSIIHWHGLHVPEEADGHPRLAIETGETYTYNFTVADRAGTYWFHPHPHGRTGPQVYAGLAGLFIIKDDEEKSLALPSGEYDIPLIIQDRIFDSDNQLVYSSSNMMGQMIGFLGNRVLVNGKPDYELKVASRSYRLRLLNGSNSRIYKLSWEDGTKLNIIGTDGGLLENTIQRDYITLAPAQRIDLWVDFSGKALESKMRLIHSSAATPGGDTTFPILSATIDREVSAEIDMPRQLTNIEYYDINDAVNANKPRQFTLSMGRGMIWTINGRTFDMTDVAREEIVTLNDLEAWEFYNQPSSGMGMGMGMGMQLPHPMHIHGLQFQILERTIESGTRSAWDTISEGFIDEGWHDTVLVMPGERVKILLKFTDFNGLYLYHCHNLEHEDMGMMRNYRVDF